MKQMTKEGKVKRNKNNSKDLQFIKGGKLNMICVRANKEVTKLDADSPAFLTNDAVIKGQSIDLITFAPHVVFKVTLDFYEPLDTVPGSTREMTDWVLCSCPGTMARFQKTEQRLELQQCVVCTPTNVEPLLTPCRVVLAFDDDEWVVERCVR